MSRLYAISIISTLGRWVGRSGNKIMCVFCNGKQIIQDNFKIYIEDKKFLVIESNDKTYCFDLGYCPFCGKKLSYIDMEKIYVSNITKKDIIDIGEIEKENKYYNNPLYTIVCDKRYEAGDSEKQISSIVTKQQLESIKEKGYYKERYIKATRPFIY